MVYFQCLDECDLQSLKYICMRKFRNKTIQEQKVNASYCYNMKIPKSRLCQSLEECIFETDSDDDFSLGMLAFLIITISFMLIIITIYLSHFVRLCLQQMYYYQ